MSYFIELGVLWPSFLTRRSSLLKDLLAYLGGVVSSVLGLLRYQRHCHLVRLGCKGIHRHSICVWRSHSWLWLVSLWRRLVHLLHLRITLRHSHVSHWLCQGLILICTRHRASLRLVFPSRHLSFKERPDPSSALLFAILFLW